MKLLEPKLAILDETDSGLDIDALRIVADGVNSHKNRNDAFLIITSLYQRFLTILSQILFMFYQTEKLSKQDAQI